MAKTFVEECVPEISSIEDIYSFFEQLGYSTLTPDYRMNLSSLGLRAKERECVEKVYVVSNYEKRFQIYFIKLKLSSLETVRSLPDLFLKTAHFPFLVFSADFINFSFVLVEKIRKGVGEFKRKVTKLNIDKSNLCHTDAEILTNIMLNDETKPDDIHKKLTEAFNVEKVTKKFFKEYVIVFKAVKEHILEQTKELKSVHDFTQQLLNRIMFIYFVAKKRWLGNDPRFMATFWQIYSEGKKKGGYQPDTFYKNWLSVMFFEAFNKKFAPRSYFPEGINKTLMLAPYLNGGLFAPNRLDDMDFSVEDVVFEQIFSFLNRYNFTIKEESPLEEEVAVDPEMIGRVYESLVNLSEESDERAEAGIFYTDRTEIDFMSRRSLVEYFYNQLPAENISKTLLYKFVFAKTDGEKKDVEKEINRLKIWHKIEDALDNLSILDPACGSGSFLVGMLSILADLYDLTYKNLNRSVDDFEIKKQIIGRSLYGVDVMEWAVHVAELRLWLQLIVESELSLGDIKTKALLPNLTFKLRPGDSLVQEIGGIDLAIRGNKDISPALKKKLTQLKQEKLKFYYSDSLGRFRMEKSITQKELSIFRAILDEKILSVAKKLKEKQKSLKPKQPGLFSPKEIAAVEPPRQKPLFELEEIIKGEIEKLTLERERFLKVKRKISKSTKPFIWDIDFVEIFADENEGGFDIVIGNPPYVRQEKIADPKIPKEEITSENKREYKEKLIHSVQNYFPFIGNLSKKSDLYVYFYFQGLALLNQTGTFCFITSNSWLDVGYGKGLQEFLLNNAKVHAIYDNSAEKSFAGADINTIIAVFSSPQHKKKDNNLENIAKFVMFKKPFDDVITTENLLRIEKAEGVTKTDDFRVYPKKQLDLLDEGWEYPEDITEEKREIYRFNIGKYGGNKWGGKYLRAPDIYYTIIEKGQDKLVSLCQLCEIKPGCYSGINDFFYLDKKTIKRFGIESSCYIPIIRSSRDINKLYVKLSECENQVFACGLLKKKMRDKKLKGALQYIAWGEGQVTRKRQKVQKGVPWPKTETVKRRSPGWWAIPKNSLIPTQNFMLYVINDRFLCPYGEKMIVSDRCFHRVFPKDNNKSIILAAILNSTLSFFFVSLLGRSGLGQGALKYETTDAHALPVLRLDILCNSESERLTKAFIKLATFRDVFSIYEECGFNPKLPIRDQEPNPLPDRKELDDIIFDILGLTKQERREVYWAVCELVKNRLDKAKSA